MLTHRAEWKGSRPLVRIAETNLDDSINRAIVEQMQRGTAAAASASEEWASLFEDELAAERVRQEHF